MKGVRIACLYSYKCQRAEVLRINDYLLDYVQNYDRTLKRKNLIVSMIEKLDSFGGYQKIYRLFKKAEFFDERVIRAYWLGNRRLKPSKINHNFTTLARFREINAEEHLPSGIIKEMLDCAVSFGEVVEVDDKNKRAKVFNQRLLYKPGRVVFGEEKREVDIRFIDNPKKGDLVSIHRAIAREKISKTQAETLENITLEALKVLKMA